MNDPELPNEMNAQPRWQPVGPIERRVLGVLVEKSKTTQDNYPMSLNALTTGCNQKNNREPQMQLSEDAVQESLDRLRPIGAVEEVQGSGRVVRFRHRLYEWLGVDKTELAVMGELLLRGDQTEGELRGRAARMAPIPDLAALRPIIESLMQKRLMLSLSSEGRGHIVSHALYLPGELEKLRAANKHAASPQSAAPNRAELASLQPTEVQETLRDELNAAIAQIAQLRRDFDELSQRCQHTEESVKQLRQSLGE